jgi:superfamily II DNA or RNA helicase
VIATADVTLLFDAGTLLLDQLDTTSPPAVVPPHCVWDERVHRFRAPAYRYREVVTHLTRAARAGTLAGFDDRARRYDDLALAQKVRRDAFDHQRDAVAAWTAAGKRGVVVLPTGSGKSYVAEMAIAQVQRATLVIAPTLDLMNQWYDILTTAFGVEVGLLGGGYHDVRELTVSTYDSAYLHMDHLGDRFGLLVFDECHHLPSPTYLRAAESAIAPYRLGLTATLERSDGREALLDDRVGAVVYARSIRDLAGEYLADYDTARLAVALSDDEAARYETQRGVYREFLRDQRINMASPDGWSRFIQVSSQSSAGRRAFLAYREQKQIAIASRGKLHVLEGLLRQHAHDRLLVFTNDNDTVYLISRTFLLPALTHQTDLKDRREILARFNSGEYPALVTSRVLNEGVNIPAANVAVVLSGTGSVREHVQRLGRILRRREGKRAMLYEVVTENTVEERVSERRREHDAYR